LFAIWSLTLAEQLLEPEQNGQFSSAAGESSDHGGQRRLAAALRGKGLSAVVKRFAGSRLDAAGVAGGADGAENQP
jgi:hypothetical protein